MDLGIIEPEKKSCSNFSWSEDECSRTCGGITNDFSIIIGLHQGSALSPFLFFIVMDELTRAFKMINRGVCYLLMILS